jgi:DNA replication protein DnaC
MYEAYYGLHERPFDLTANPRFLFLSSGHREALSNVQYGIDANKGITLLIGEAGTGKTHLASGLCIAACEQRRRVRFTTATALVNELVEARAANLLSRALGRWERIELICLDELGYVPLAEIGAELLFQVIADRAERAAVIVTSNLPFSEWGQVFPNARLCQALVDRLTDRAHILETGTESYRFRRTLAGSRGTA